MAYDWAKAMEELEEWKDIFDPDAFDAVVYAVKRMIGEESDFGIRTTTGKEGG